jgi:hypothetical protein
MREQAMLGVKTALAVIGLAFAAAPAHAGFRPLFRPDEFYKPANNLSQCQPSVRQSIKQAKVAWGDFQFSCVHGVVQRIYVSTSSRIGPSVAQFIEENGALLGLGKKSLAVAMKGDSGSIAISGNDRGYISRHFWEERPRSGSGPGGTIATRDLLRAPGVIGPPDVKKPLIIIEVVFPPVPSEGKPN